jgi:hypothetical protein
MNGLFVKELQLVFVLSDHSLHYPHVLAPIDLVNLGDVEVDKCVFGLEAHDLDDIKLTGSIR